MKTESKTLGTDMRKLRRKQWQYLKSTGQTPTAKKSNEMNKKSRRRPWAEPGERSVIINEYESDKTSRTKQFSQLQTWRNHSLNTTRKEVDEKM